MAEQGIKIAEKNGIVFLSGIMDEASDLSSLLGHSEPLILNFKEVTRFNSTGIRNILRFCAQWGTKRLEYIDCPCDLIDQINMIPALLGPKGSYSVNTLFVPYECRSCGFSEEVLDSVKIYDLALKSGSPLPSKVCPKCAGTMAVISESYFVFLNR